MTTQIITWINAHPWLVAVGSWAVGWVIPSPWGAVLDAIDKLAIHGIQMARLRLVKSGATPEELAAFDKKLLEVATHLQEDVKEGEKEQPK